MMDAQLQRRAAGKSSGGFEMRMRRNHLASLRELLVATRRDEGGLEGLLFLQNFDLGLDELELLLSSLHDGLLGIVLHPVGHLQTIGSQLRSLACSPPASPLGVLLGDLHHPLGYVLLSRLETLGLL